MYAFGGGGNADIFQGSYKGKMVALKRLRTFMHDADRNAIHQALGHEAAIWRQLQHSHVLPFLGIDAHTFAPHYALVSPWMKHGNLVEYIKSNAATSTVINRLLKQAVEGLAYLHEQGIVHGDLRAANILINESGEACLADFGLSRLIAVSLATSSHRHTNARWTSPELLKGESHSSGPPSDVYAFGCVCIEAYTLKVPFWSVQNDAAVIGKVICGVMQQRPGLDECAGNAISDDMWELIESCWRSEPWRRPNAVRAWHIMHAMFDKAAAVRDVPRSQNSQLNTNLVADFTSRAPGEPSPIRPKPTLRFQRAPDWANRMRMVWRGDRLPEDVQEPESPMDDDDGPLSQITKTPSWSDASLPSPTGAVVEPLSDSFEIPLSRDLWRRANVQETRDRHRPEVSSPPRRGEDRDTTPQTKYATHNLPVAAVNQLKPS
ncbi:kinase-like protein [Punctularia strigosozonata HHB-11173 SS5]|uniref:kinase-like protein n=1 Tax=Punctularia strigosozonata (strain HHB-11173) TaxID=741275 RepID=UPI000441785C|nr:kinase-like protein [Punctularia strigosozonata HHB-11173 SS5]EIN08812.1 kinase-like protein [Punctularia strigosozonata HHB-11173 SS5]